MSTFKAVSPKQNFPQMEESILEFWKKHKIFEKTIEDKSKPVFSFYEGPPTANGIPGIHHVLTRAFKDIFPRFKTMQGYFVARKAGWDCHGLPVEVEVEKKLGLKGKKQIELFGIEKFNDECKKSVLQYISHWDKLTQRIGYWLDTEHPYKTLDNSYIESVWHLLSQLQKQGLLAKNYKITKHCPRCETSLAEAEAGQGMKETIDPAITVRIKAIPETIKDVLYQSKKADEQKFLLSLPLHLLIWTTTPWTLPSNSAVAVNPQDTYLVCLLETTQELVIVHENRANAVLGENLNIVEKIKGNQLINLKYEPLYLPPSAQNKHYLVIGDEMVLSSEGTGLVHISPPYGDLDVGQKNQLPFYFSVGLDGLMTFPDFCVGRFFKQADPLIIENLKTNGRIFAQDKIRHNYPFCWRCDTPLIYFAKYSWYILTTHRKEQLLRANESINFYPSHIKEGRFGDWLRNNVDWAISRERYFGTPIPLWVCNQCDHHEWVGSIGDLSKLSGKDLSTDPAIDLHRPYVDKISFPCTIQNCSGKMERIKEVLDCWLDSGAMPYAQHHFPFENRELFATHFPANFICEAIDQTRGWFYTLHALSVLSHNSPAYKNCLVLGHILDEQGRKMSKRLGNIVDPWTVLNSEGADALRYCMYTASPLGQPRRFSQALVKESLRKFILTIWNCYSFFTTYAELDYDKLSPKPVEFSSLPTIDQWILGQLHRLIQKVTWALEQFDVSSALKEMTDFVELLSNWYLRRNRDRFWANVESSQNDSPQELSKRAAYQTLHTCLVGLSQLLAPFLPFLSEELWQNLARPVVGQAALSVHLSSWPLFNQAIIDATEELIKDMDVVLEVISLGRQARIESNIKVRQPLSSVKIQLQNSASQERLHRFEKEIKEELNVEELYYAASNENLVEFIVRPDLPKLGKKYGSKVKSIQNLVLSLSQDEKRTWAQQSFKKEAISCLLEGESFILEPDEILVTFKTLPGYAAKGEGGVVVALSTEITPELRNKGIAREVVRTIGEMRKEAGCHVSDEIFVHLSTESLVLNTSMNTQLFYIGEQTLSTFIDKRNNDAMSQREIELDEGKLMIEIYRATASNLKG